VEETHGKGSDMLRKPLAVAATVVAATLGSYGIASAASGASATTTATGAAQAKLGSGATIVRVETDADGNATYEAHATKADGTPVTVSVDASYDVVSVEAPS
jgi:hypothetical protein